jgi:sugar O-acyltransferase (sialic acid O-acetyltransferase NeuD family)
VADIALAMRIYEEIEFLCNFDKKKECMGFPIVGRVSDAEKFIGDADFIVAIGEGHMRQELQERLEEKGADFATLIHPSAVIGSHVQIGSGTVVMPGAIVNAETVIGKGCIINTSSSVDHGCKLGDYVHIAVGAHVCGIVNIGQKTWVGAGATVINGVNVCADCMIGAGAVVIKNIKETGTYIGVPARRKEDA